MLEEEIIRLREKMYLLISEKADYKKVLEASQELDEAITEFICKKQRCIKTPLTGKIIESTIYENDI